MLVLGVLFLLGTLNVWPEFTFMKYWPLVLVLGGLHGLFCNCGGSKDAACDSKGGKSGCCKQ